MAHGRARVARKSTKSNAKGKKWIKGQSSSSNPSVNKYREEAKKGYFVLNAGSVPDKKSTLTADALLKHEAQLQNEDELCHYSQALSIADDLEDAEVKTFASNWTTCTNPSFESFLKNWKPHLASHKDRLAILAAVTDVIKQNNGKATETEYFAALLTTLGVLEDPVLLSAGVTILSMVIKKVPSSVLKVKFSESTKLFQDLIDLNIDGQNPKLLRGLIGCMSVVLRVQEVSVWKHSSTIQTYLKILSLSVHPKPRVRKAAQHAVDTILRGSCFMLSNSRPLYHPATLHTAEFCIHQLHSAGSVASPTVLHIFSLLKSVLALFSTDYIKSTWEAVFRCRLSANNVLVNTWSLHVLQGLFVSRPNKENLPSELNAEIIIILHDYQPSIKDSKQLISWITVLKEALLNLLRLNGRLCLEQMVKFFSTITRLWASPKNEIRTAVTATLKTLLNSFESSIVNEIENDFLLNHEDMSVEVKKLFESVDSCLTYQFLDVWGSVFQVLSVFYEVFGKIGKAFMGKCLKSLAQLRNSASSVYSNEIDGVIGQAVKSCGPKMVLHQIPLNLENERPNLDQSWLILVLRDNIQETELCFFNEYFLPLIKKFNQKANHSASTDNNALVKTYQLLVAQLWSLLPGFCNLPTDLAKSFKLIAKVLGDVLKDGYADYKLHILTAIRLLISKNLNNDENKSEMSKFAKNFLPILFALYSKPPSSTEKHPENFRTAVFDTIKTYLDITDRERCKTFFQDGLNFLTNPEVEVYRINAVLDITRVLLPHLPKESVEELYIFCVPLLKSENRTTQKKAYRILEEICIGKSDALVEFVKLKLEPLKNILANSLSSTSPSAKAPRLRCLNYIVLQLHEDDKTFLFSIIPEVISCAKESAQKVRLAAITILINIGEKFIKFGGKNDQEIIKDYIDVLLAGLAGSSHLICATIAAISHLLHHFREKISNNVLNTLFKSLILLGKLKTRIVIGEVLDFIKTVISSFDDIVVASLIVKIFDIVKNLSKDCQLHFSMKIRRVVQRLIRKMGLEMVQGLIPESYQKLLSYIRKQEIRDKKSKAEPGLSEEVKEKKFSKSQSIEELLQDSDSDDDEEEDNKKSSKITQKQSAATWIHEEAETGIVDFLDPKASKNILATKPDRNPQKRKRANDIKYTANGQMIIFEDKEDTASSDALDFIDDHKANKRKRSKVDDDDDSKSFKDITETSNVDKKNKETVAMKKKRLSYGAEYKAKKAGGDMKRKGKPDPYAYLPLEIQSLNKRKKAKMSGKFNSLVRSARKGAKLGKQGRTHRKHMKLL